VDDWKVRSRDISSGISPPENGVPRPIPSLKNIGRHSSEPAFLLISENWLTKAKMSAFNAHPPTSGSGSWCSEHPVGEND